jgi:nicotinate-nucleotide--dimethylbenzimidazole phosphoribosyltransferase
MSLDGYHSILVLGGIRSGKSEFAEDLVNDAVEVRYVATASRPQEDDPEWTARVEAHRRRRPPAWTTEETGVTPARLATLLAEAKAGETLLVDDLGGWLAAVLDEGDWSAGADREPVAGLVAAVRACPATVVIVSPEVGMSVVPATTSGRLFADAVGGANRLLAQACDAVALVVAGQPDWLKLAPSGATRAGAPGGSPEPLTAPLAPAGPAEPVLPPAGTGALAPGAVPPGATIDAGAVLDAGAVSDAGAVLDAADAGAVLDAAVAGAVLDAAAAGAVLDATGVGAVLDAAAGAVSDAAGAADAGGTGPDDGAEGLDGSILELKDMPYGSVIEAGMDLPLPDEAATSAAEERIHALDVTGPGLGNLARAVTFAAGAQGSGPRPFQSVRVLLLHGDHLGGVAAGDNPQTWADRVRQAREGVGPLGLLAARAGARLQVVDVDGADGEPVGQPIESGTALAPERVDAALRYGLKLADSAADEGTDLLVLAAAGAGQQAAAAAVVAASTTTEVVALLPRVHQPGGVIDDEAWMVRCGAIRDALRGLRGRSRDARSVLAALAGADIAVAVGVLVGAAARRVPVMIDGPVGIAAAAVAKDISGVTRHWTLLAEHGDHPTVKAGAELLGLEPLLDLRLGLGEGVAALAALPLIQATLSIVDSA